ncbi:MAG TPA: uroporphyrinogen-III synthase [Candidatus Acidoferrales bacterium]|nr:uroporphyrinogen-III synthase [Candidatus Acidoferrales bacterium]
MAAMSAIDNALAGKRIVVTSAPEQSQSLTDRLRAHGAEILELPTVSFAPPENWRALDERLKRLDAFDAILFLSKNAVRYVFERMKQLGIGREMAASGRPLIAAVGPATARALEMAGVRPGYVAKNHSGEALVRELRGSLAGRRVLLPRSDRGERMDPRVPAALREAGAQVEEVVAYRTVTPSEMNPAVLEQIRRAEVDAIVFASPSAFQGLRESISADDLAALSHRMRFATIGPTTSRALAVAGVTVEIEATEPSGAGLADSIAGYFRQRPAQRTTTK